MVEVSHLGPVVVGHGCWGLGHRGLGRFDGAAGQSFMDLLGNKEVAGEGGELGGDEVVDAEHPWAESLDIGSVKLGHLPHEGRDDIDLLGLALSRWCSGWRERGDDKGLEHVVPIGGSVGGEGKADSLLDVVGGTGGEVCSRGSGGGGVAIVGPIEGGGIGSDGSKVRGCGIEVGEDGPEVSGHCGEQDSLVVGSAGYGMSMGMEDATPGGVIGSRGICRKGREEGGDYLAGIG